MVIRRSECVNWLNLLYRSYTIRCKLLTMRSLINVTHICVYRVCPCVAMREYSMLEHSCQSFVPDCFWFSDSADWMWPCDPWLPGRESGGAMAAGASVGESQLQRIIRDLHGTPALCVCACLCECVWIDWLQAAVGWHCVTGERRKKRLDVMTWVSASSLNTIFTPGIIWPLFVVKSFGKTCTWPHVAVERVWWQPLSACSETESAYWGCTRHGCPSSFYDGYEASGWEWKWKKICLEIEAPGLFVCVTRMHQEVKVL